MLKKTAVLVVVAILALAVASPVLAGGRGRGAGRGQAAGREGPARHGPEHPERQKQEELPGRPYFTLVGLISELTSATITAVVHNGNQFVKPYAGQTLTVELTDSTVYRRWTPAGCVEISLADLETGDTTSIHGSVVEDVFVAERVTVDVPVQ